VKYLELHRHFFSKLSGFLALTILTRHTKNQGRFLVVFFELGGGEEKILTPFTSPNFGYREFKIEVLPLDLHGPHLRSEFRDLSPKNVAWGDDRRNLKKSHFSTRGGIFK